MPPYPRPLATKCAIVHSKATGRDIPERASLRATPPPPRPPPPPPRIFERHVHWAWPATALLRTARLGLTGQLAPKASERKFCLSWPITKMCLPLTPDPPSSRLNIATALLGRVLAFRTLHNVHSTQCSMHQIPVHLARFRAVVWTNRFKIGVVVVTKTPLLGSWRVLELFCKSSPFIICSPF